MLGIVTVLLSALVLAFHNLTVRILFSEHLFLGVVLLGGYVQPTLQNSFLLMFLRMLVVVPMMAGLAPQLYPTALREFIQLFAADRRLVLRQAVVCGVIMFVYIAALYVAIGLIPTGIAMTLFFTYPVFTALLSWKLLGAAAGRPSRFRWIVMLIILGGSVLVVPPFSSTSNYHLVAIGVAASVVSGMLYALYTVLAQQCLEQLHPIPFTWISFAITLLFSGICLLIWHQSLTDLDWTPIWIGSIFSGVVSFVGHSLNNMGIRMVGATAAAMLGSSSPALTALVAWSLIQEKLNAIQVLGILIVTLGVALLSGERWLTRRSPPHQV